MNSLVLRVEFGYMNLVGMLNAEFERNYRFKRFSNSHSDQILLVRLKFSKSVNPMRPEYQEREESTENLQHKDVDEVTSV